MSKAGSGIGQGREREGVVVSATGVKPATKYRVAIRAIAVENGWSFTQKSAETDRFEKSGTVVEVHHGPSNLITRAERADGRSNVESTGRAGKMFAVQAWLTGEADPGRERFIRLSPEQVAVFESGEGIAALREGVSVSPAKAAPPRRSRSKKSAPAGQGALL